MTLRPAAVALLATLLSLPALADDKPLWELGVGLGVLRLPHYKGSDQQHTEVAPEIRSS